MPKIILKDKELLSTKIIEIGENYKTFSSSLGITGSYLSMIVNGKKNPSPKLAKRILEKLSLDFSDIFFTE